MIKELINLINYFLPQNMYVTLADRLLFQKDNKTKFFYFFIQFEALVGGKGITPQLHRVTGAVVALDTRALHLIPRLLI